jgi:Winged helix-turn helix
MTRRTPIAADEATLAELRARAKSKLRAEAHRALAVQGMLEGVGDAEIAARRGIGLSTVRTHRIAFARDGVAGLRAKPQTGRPAVKGPAGGRGRRAPGARAPGGRSTGDPGADPGRVPGRDRADHRRRTPQRGAPEKRGFSWRKPRHTLAERQDLAAVAAGRARLAELKAQAAGAIRLLFGDESELSTDR